MIMALVIATSASFNSVVAANKKTVKTVKKQPAVVLKSSSDSVSYAAGKAATDGLIPYLQQQFHVDAAHMADFAKGFEEAISKRKDPKFVAYMTGMQIATMAEQRILPSAKSEFVGTKDSVSAEMFYKGFAASLTKDNSIFTDSAAIEFFKQRREQIKIAKHAAYKAENDAWLANNARKEGVVTLPSGLQYKVITEGKGEKPLVTDEVVVKYEGKLIDGTEFDSSYKRNPQTSSFRCDQVIKGWTEALSLMPVGSKWELYIPQELAYGERQAGQIKPYSTLIFTVELVDIKKPEAPQEEKETSKESKKEAKKEKKKDKKK